MADTARSRVLWERRAHQYALERDSLRGLARQRAEQLDATVQLNAHLTLAYQDLRAQLVGDTVREDDAGVRYAYLEADTLGDHIEVNATVPPPPLQASGNILVRRDPEKVWVSLLETPNGERLLLAETRAQVQAAIDSVSTQAPAAPAPFDLSGIFDPPNIWQVALAGGACALTHID